MSKSVEEKLQKHIKQHQIYMKMVHILAKTSECEPAHGVFFVKDKRIIVSSASEGEGKSSTSHAIQVALHKAAGMGAGVTGSVCYTTEDPCKHCQVALDRAGVDIIMLDGENNA